MRIPISAAYQVHCQESACQEEARKRAMPVGYAAVAQRTPDDRRRTHVSPSWRNVRSLRPSSTTIGMSASEANRKHDRVLVEPQPSILFVGCYDADMYYTDVDFHPGRGDGLRPVDWRVANNDGCAVVV